LQLSRRLLGSFGLDKELRQATGWTPKKPSASTFTRTPINALLVPQPSGAHPPTAYRGSNRLGPDVLEPDDIERDFVFRVKSSDAVLLGADLALLMSVLLHDFDAPRKRRIPLFTTVLLHAKPAYACDRNNGGCYRNLACDCLHSNSIVK
jgi:hypothetical protein